MNEGGLTQVGKETDETTSSDEESSSSEDESPSEEEESTPEEEPTNEVQKQIMKIKEKLKEMVKINPPDESAGLDIMKTIIKIPVTKQILLETDIINTVYDFREICKSDEIYSADASIVQKLG